MAKKASIANLQQADGKIFQGRWQEQRKMFTKIGRTIVRPMRFPVCSEEALGKH